MAILPWLLIFGVFYFLLILPQKKRQKALQDMIRNLKVGDQVVTNSGIVGTITSLKDDRLMLKTANVNIEIQRSAVASTLAEAKDSK